MKKLLMLAALSFALPVLAEEPAPAPAKGDAAPPPAGGAATTATKKGEGVKKAKPEGEKKDETKKEEPKK